MRNGKVSADKIPYVDISYSNARTPKPLDP